jgi:threonine aldolase
MVFVTVPAARLAELQLFLDGRGVLTIARSATVRLVTHLDVDAAGIERALSAFRDYFARR